MESFDFGYTTTKSPYVAKRVKKKFFYKLKRE